MEQNRRTTHYLLKNLPALWLQVHQQADDAIRGSPRGDPAGNRRAQGGHSDPTANRAITLSEAHSLADRLAQVRRWIDTELNPQHRQLLLTMWRMRDFGWRWVSRELHLGVSECQKNWELMVVDLASYLKRNC